MGSPIHGFDEDGATRRLIRSRPPAAALRWVGEVLGGRVTAVRALRGGLSSATHLVTVALPGGGTERVVLRRYVRPELNAEEPDLPVREATTLRVLDGRMFGTAAVPRLVALDPVGARAGVPAVLMSRVPGRVDWDPRDLPRWTAAMAEVLAEVHATPPPRAACAPSTSVSPIPTAPPDSAFGPYAPYEQLGYDPPGWARRPGDWVRAVAAAAKPGPDEPAAFLHRDFHPGNLLWRRGRVTGLVDWQAAATGPACVDVGHCRVNLLRYGLEVADAFAARWEELTGRRYPPWADVVSAVDMLDELRELPPGRRREAVEAFVERAVGRLG